MDDLGSRLASLEDAIVAIGELEFGDHKGHDFHGNQWVDAGEEGKGKDDDKEKKRFKEGTKLVGKLFNTWKDDLKEDSRLMNALLNPTKAQRKALGYAARVEALELAVLALADTQLQTAEFGDLIGHLFRGNQWRTGDGDVVVREHKSDEDKANVIKDGKKIGSVVQVGKFGKGSLDEGGFEGRPHGAEPKEFDTPAEAVQHVIDNGAPKKGAADEVDWAEWEQRKNMGWATGIAASG